MPVYRKKRRNRFMSAPKKAKVRPAAKSNTNDIKMTSEKNRKVKKNPVNMKVVNGGKFERQKRFKLLLAIVAALTILIIVLEQILPAGILKTLSNTLAIMGNGNYPIELESTDTIDAKPLGSYYYLLTNTELSAYSNSGKKVLSYNHGFEKPVLKSSEWGALLFNQGDNNVLVFDIKKLRDTVITKKAVINAEISDSGVYAIVTEEDGYAGAVTVYDKNSDEVYKWYSADEIINDVAIYPGKDKIAVSTFKVENGEYKSKVSVLEFDSATPVFTSDYSGRLIYSINSKNSSGIVVTTNNGVDFLRWKENEKYEYKNEYDTALVRSSSNGTVAVFNRKSDPTHNKIVVLNKKGKLDYKFDFNEVVSDIFLFGGHIYCMSDTDIYVLDEKGKKIESASCGFGAVRMVVTGRNVVAVITDNKIEKIKLD